MTKDRGTWALYIDQSCNGILDLLEGKKIFPTQFSIVIFAAAIGMGYDRSFKTKKNGKGYRWDNTEVCDALKKAQFCALYSTENSTILQNDNECYKIFGEYANGGFEWLSEQEDESQTEVGFFNSILNTMEELALDNSEKETSES